MIAEIVKKNNAYFLVVFGNRILLTQKQQFAIEAILRQQQALRYQEEEEGDE